MMGAPVGRQDRLFYEFDLEDMVPGDHLLRRIEAALLYTAGPKLIVLGDAVLAPHKPGLVATKANLPG